MNAPGTHEEPALVETTVERLSTGGFPLMFMVY